MKKLVLSLLALTTLGSLSLPAIAEGNDTANIQDAVQVNTTDGTGNTTIQRGSQGIRTYRNNDGNGAVGNVQTILQDSMTTGENNSVRQDMEQRIRVRREMRGGRSETVVEQ